MLALNPLKESIFIYRAKLEKNIATSFMDKQLDYVVQELSFVKNPSLAAHAKSLARNISNDTNSNDNSFDDSSLLNASVLNSTSNQLDPFADKHQKPTSDPSLALAPKTQRKHHLIWQHTTFHR